MRRPAYLISHLALAACIAAAPARGQGAAAPGADDADTSESIVVTAQRANRTEVTHDADLGAFGNKSGLDVPFSVKSYNSALILNQQPTTLGQLLENDPSIRTTYGFGNAAEQFVIRGFSLASDDLALDGLYGLAPRQLVAPELYESVQVLNGASAFLNGAAPSGSAVGGTVNLIPKHAGDRDLTRITGTYISDAHAGGSVDVSRRFGGNDEFGVRVNGAARRGDVAVDDEFRSTYVVGGAFDYRGADVRLSLDINYQRYKVTHLRSKVVVGALTSIPRVPRAKANYNQDFSYSTLRDVFGVARAEWDVADNAMLYASFGARDGSENGVYNGITVLDAATGAGRGSALFVPRTDNNEAGQAGLRVKLAARGITQEINVGVAANWQVNRNAFDFRDGFATNLYDTPRVPYPPSTVSPFFTNPAGNLDDPNPVTRTRLVSAFASDTIGLFGDRVLVSGGLRLQQITNKSYDYSTRERAPVYEVDAVTPVVGIVVKPVRGVSLFANRVEALTPGTVVGVSATDAATGALLPVSNAGETVPAAKSLQYEVGGKLAIGRVNASLAAFQIDQPLSYAMLDAARPGFVVVGLFGEQRNRGIELSVDGELARGLRVIAGGSVLDAKLHRTGDPATEGRDAPGVPDYLVNGNVEYDLPFVPGLTLTGRVVHTGRQTVIPAIDLRLPKWTRVDLGGRFVAAIAEKPVTFRFGVDNVANRRFWTSAFDVFSPQLLQGTPRTYRASASIDL